eukprot:TRINITY_DN62226_c0_g1_i1.p1 TRINITY_DN62226_c0_g1~~TRINITY_DN62226_c0_g1_i1.p1  ORF type:complete len:561 (+),score=110.78 TRINITY_DN62226_c0_g1_i1:78-1685(+)
MTQKLQADLSGELESGGTQVACALAVLGMPDATVSSAGDLETVRKKTKELYKSFKSLKKEADAKQVLEAFDVVKRATQKLVDAEKQRSTRQKQKALAKMQEALPVVPDAASEDVFAGLASEGSITGLKKDGFRLHESSYVKPILGPSLPTGEDEAEFRRTGTIPICSCGQVCTVQRLVTAETFVCHACRIRAMDPFNQVIEGKKGMLKLLMMRPPLLPEDAALQAKFKVQIVVPDVQAWLNAGHNVEVRMCRLDTCAVTHAWPDMLSCQINGQNVFEIERPQEGHARRDVPKRILAIMRSGENMIRVSLEDNPVTRFALALVRTYHQTPEDLFKLVPRLSMEDCRRRTVQLLFSSLVSGTGEEVLCPGFDRSCLQCPITLVRIKTPARGYKCQHVQCFDLDAYLVSNYRMEAFNKRWHCPVCNIFLRPPRDFIDQYFSDILSITEEDDGEITFDSDGGWKVTGKIPSPASPCSEDMQDSDRDTDVCTIVSIGSEAKAGEASKEGALPPDGSAPEKTLMRSAADPVEMEHSKRRRK